MRIILAAEEKGLPGLPPARPDFWPGFVQIFEQMFGQVLDQGERNIQFCKVYLDEEYSFAGPTNDLFNLSISLLLIFWAELFRSSPHLGVW